jgi:hypothetical protein
VTLRRDIDRIDCLQVLIERGTPAGFRAIAQARQKILQMENKKIESDNAVDTGSMGAHVVAPVINSSLYKLRLRAAVITNRWKSPVLQVSS